jgi:hypothetical protein
MNVQISTHVGEYIAHDEGKKSLCNEVVIITKRSNHIPMFTKIEMMKTKVIFLLNFLNQKNCGEITLQEIIDQ